MTNANFIKGFLTKEITRDVCNHLMIKNGELINYSTVLAKWDDKGKLYVNIRKYSNTTGRIQAELRWQIKKLGLDRYINNYEEYFNDANWNWWNYGQQGARKLTKADLGWL